MTLDGCSVAPRFDPHCWKHTEEEPSRRLKTAFTRDAGIRGKSSARHYDARVVVAMVSVDTPPAKVRQVMLDSGFSRLPCYGENLDDVLG
jgi:hypothetical protein